MADLLFKISGVIHILIVIMTYLPKKKQKTLNYLVFNSLIAGSTLVLILDLLSVYFGIYFKESIISPITSKVYLCSLILWMITFVTYIKIITSPDDLEGIRLNDKERIKVFHKMLIKSAIAVVIAVVGIAIIPLILTTDGESLFMSGKCMIFFNICYALCIVTWVISIIKNRKTFDKDKLPAMIASTLFATISLIVQLARPEHPVMSFAFSLITMVTYHGIHNPDLATIEALNEATQQANAANRAKSDFLSSMSHEIRTPLNAIVGFSQALAKKEISGSAQEEAQEIINASNSLLETINGILDISKLEANKIDLVKTDYSTEELIKEIQTLSTMRKSKKDIQLNFDIDENLPKVLYGDNSRIKQIIMNIMSNAIKYTNQGSVTLKMEALTNKEKCLLTISIEDTGVGMTQESIDMLFDKFQRFDIDKYTTIEGTGLGMAMTKGLVDLMNGSIAVDSEYGKGSKFTITLEQEISTKDIQEVVAELNSYIVTPFNAAGQKVLVVDDNRINLKVAERFLEPYNVDIDFCVSGRECIDKIVANEKYDLILLDIMMPKMKGTEVIKELKKLPGFEIPVVALTADAINGVENKYTELGFNDCVTKPIVELDLYNVLKKYLKESDGTSTEPRKVEAIPKYSSKKQDISATFTDLPEINYLSEIMSMTPNDVFQGHDPVKPNTQENNPEEGTGGE